MNKLIVLSAVPGSGKSYFTSALKERKKNSHLYVVSSDALRTQIGGIQTNFKNDKLMWKMYYKIAKVYSLDKKGIVVLDSTNITRDLRINKVKPLSKYFDEVDLVIFDIERDTLFRHNEDRPFPVPTEVLEDFLIKFEKPNKEDEEFFNKIYTVSSRHFEDIIDQIVS